MTQNEKNAIIGAIKKIYTVNRITSFDVWPSAERLYQLENQFGMKIDSKIYNLVNISVNDIIDILGSDSPQSLPLKVVILQRLLHNNYLSPAHLQQVISFISSRDMSKFKVGFQSPVELFLETMHDMPFEEEFIFASMECYVILGFEDSLIRILNKSQMFINTLYPLFGITQNDERYEMQRAGINNITEIEQIFDLSTYMMTMLELETGMFLSNSPFLSGNPVPIGNKSDIPPTYEETIINLPEKEAIVQEVKNFKKLDNDYGF